jgi:hypothetical protein
MPAVLTLAAFDGLSLILGALIGGLASVILAVVLQPTLEAWRFRALARVQRGRTEADPLDGIWRSHYVYETSEAEEPQVSEHFVVFREAGRHVKGRSLPKPERSDVTLTLFREGRVIGGFWRERTSRDRLYHGTLQVLLNPTGDEMRGRWVGFTSKGGIRNGDWRFHRQTRDLRRRTRRAYADRPDLA